MEVADLAALLALVAAWDAVTFLARRTAAHFVSPNSTSCSLKQCGVSGALTRRRCRWNWSLCVPKTTSIQVKPHGDTRG